ncbi:MAG: acyltransferase [Candidatus Delongbacteria bacterium]|nr:acyltransferase [Candidatus Delongbacteria bacterium]
MFFKFISKCLEIRNRIRSSYYRKLLNIPKNNKFRIYGQIDIVNPKNIKIDDNVAINHRAYLNGSGGIEISKDVVISAHVKIISTGLDTTNWGKRKDGSIVSHTGKPIFVGEKCWIGAGTTILAGVNITGKGIIIAANSVVNKDFSEDNVIIGGTPAKIIKKIEN